MILAEILSKQIPNLKSSNKLVSDIIANSNNKVVGIGAQSIAYLHKKFPGKVIKTIQISGTSDPSYQFIRMCLKHQDNPYFPKIFSVKMYNSKQYNKESDRYTEFDNIVDNDVPPAAQNNVLIVVTEKLTDMTGITLQDLERYGIEDFPIPSKMKGYKRQHSIQFRLAFKDRDFRQYMQQVVTDQHLKQALRLLEPLFRHYEPDMHDGNIMIRQPNQWVFIDPVVFDSGD